jgi:hypothetical protein
MVKVSVLNLASVHTEAAGGVTLRITVDQERFLLRGSQACGKVNRGRSFADTALLIGYTYDFTHEISFGMTCRFPFEFVVRNLAHYPILIKGFFVFFVLLTC